LDAAKRAPWRGKGWRRCHCREHFFSSCFMSATDMLGQTGRTSNGFGLVHGQTRHSTWVGGDDMSISGSVRGKKEGGSWRAPLASLLSRALDVTFDILQDTARVLEILDGRIWTVPAWIARGDLSAAELPKATCPQAARSPARGYPSTYLLQ
jgi:hypothetical protein